MLKEKKDRRECFVKLKAFLHLAIADHKSVNPSQSDSNSHSFIHIANKQTGNFNSTGLHNKLTFRWGEVGPMFRLGLRRTMMTRDNKLRTGNRNWGRLGQWRLAARACPGTVRPLRWRERRSRWLKCLAQGAKRHRALRRLAKSDSG